MRSCVADKAPRPVQGAHARAAAALAGLAQLLAIEAARGGSGTLGEPRSLPRAPATLDAPHVCVEARPPGQSAPLSGASAAWAWIS